MTEESEVSLETDHLAEVIESAQPGQPVVVIQYRSRGLPWYFAIPLLLLVGIGSVAFYHRLTSRARRDALAYAATVTAASTSASQVESTPLAEETTAPGGTEAFPALPVTPLNTIPVPLALNSQPIAPGDLSLLPATGSVSTIADQGTPKPPGAAPASTPDSPPQGHGPLDPARGVPPSPVPATAAPAPQPPPGQVALKPTPVPRRDVSVGFSAPVDEDNPFAELDIARKPPQLPGVGPAADEQVVADSRPTPTRDQLLGDIEAEAAEKKAELQQLRDMKDQAGDAITAEARARTEDDRVLFRRELAEAIKIGGKKASLEIDELCNKYGRNYDPALRARVSAVLARSAGKLQRDAKVRLLRRFGVPEPGILDFLANDIHRLINTRNGPRDTHEVRINAARTLLSIKLTKEGPVAAKGLQARTGTPGG